MISLLHRASLRHLLRHPWQLGLSVLGVAVAVAVVVGIDLANASATRAFRLSVEAVAGEATHEIVGGPSGLDEVIYTRLRVETGLRRSSPLVRGHARTPRLPGRTLEILGVDPFAEPPFRSYTGTLAQGGDLAAFLTRSGAAALGTGLAGELKVSVGDRVPLEIGGRPTQIEVVALLEPRDDLGRAALENLLVVDVATAQELLDRPGRLSAIDLRLEGAEREADLAAIAAVLPPGAVLQPKTARTGALEQMTRAFQLNLTALSLLALVVGMFLIYNTLTFSVVQRRALIGRLRALGVLRGEVFALVLAEAAAIGVLGTVAGLALGTVLARGLLELVVRTINDLYFVLSVREVALAPLSLAKGALLGVGTTLLAALVPAHEATATLPHTALRRSALETRARGRLPMVTAIGVGGLALGGGLLLVPSKNLVLSFAAVFSIVLGCALLTPAATVAAAGLLRAPMTRVFGLLGAMAARGMQATLSRTGVAMAALVIAVATSIGVATMVASFRATLVEWLELTLQADVYVSPAAAGGRSDPSVLDPEVAQTLASTPGVALATSIRRVWVPAPGGSVQLAAVAMEKPAFRVYRLAAGERETAWKAFREQGAALISEPFAYKRGLRVGDRVELTTDRGSHRFEIAGVFYDYASDAGMVMLHRATYDKLWDDRSVHSLGLYLEPGTEATAFLETLRKRAGERQELSLRPSQELRRLSLEIFDRTFVVTEVLRLLAGIVAFIGVLSALMALQLEREKELGVLRANGLTPAQVWGLVTAQTGLMGLVAGLLAIPVGVAMAALLVEVINRRSFGWTLQLVVSPAVLGQAVALALAAALLAGLWPAWKMSRASPALALREE